MVDATDENKTDEGTVSSDYLFSNLDSVHWMEDPRWDVVSVMNEERKRECIYDVHVYISVRGANIGGYLDDIDETISSMNHL